MAAQESGLSQSPQWFVLRDLKRPNSLTPAYRQLPELGFEVFTPMHWVLEKTPDGGNLRVRRPFISSLLFVKAQKPELDPVILRIPTLQYRFVKGAPQNTPMVVPVREMDDFIKATSSAPDCTFYAPDELSPDMIGRKVMICGGHLNGTCGNLLKLRGSKKKRLIVRLEGILAATIEVNSDFIQFL